MSDPRIRDLIPTKTILEDIRERLAHDDTESVIILITEITGRLRNLGAIPPGGLPTWATEEPPSTGSRYWDTYLATGMAYTLEQIGGRPEPWMDDAKPFPYLQTAGDEDLNPALRERLLAQTPARFLEKNIISRDRDWTIA